MRIMLIMPLVVGVFALSACGQRLRESQVPAVVKVAFQKQYPDAKAHWGKEDANYEANFKKEGREMSAIIDESGTIVETETMIAVSDLPASISDYMEKHYPGLKVKEAARIVKANGELNYEAEIAHKDIVFDGSGKFIKEQKE